MEQTYLNGNDTSTAIKKIDNRCLRHPSITLKYEESECKDPVSLNV